MTDRITFISTSRSARTGQTEKVILSIETVALDEAVSAFERFLRGAGFYFDGHLELVEDINIQVDNPERSV